MRPHEYSRVKFDKKGFEHYKMQFAHLLAQKIALQKSLVSKLVETMQEHKLQSAHVELCTISARTMLGNFDITKKTALDSALSIATESSNMHDIITEGMRYGLIITLETEALTDNTGKKNHKHRVNLLAQIID